MARHYAVMRIPVSLAPWRVTARVATADGHEATVAFDVRADMEENAKTVEATGGRVTEDAAPPRDERKARPPAGGAVG